MHAIDSASSSEAGGILQAAMITRDEMLPLSAVSIFCDGKSFLKEFEKHLDIEEIHGKLHVSFKQFSAIRECLMHGASRRELENMSLKHSSKAKRVHSNGIIKIERRWIKASNAPKRLAAQYTYRVTVEGEEIFFPVGVDARKGIKKAEMIHREIKKKVPLSKILKKFHPTSRKIKSLEVKEKSKLETQGQNSTSLPSAYTTNTIVQSVPENAPSTRGIATIGQLTKLLKDNALALGLANSTVKGYVFQLNKILICGISKYQKSKHFSPPPKGLMKEPVSVLTSEVAIEFRRFILDKIADKAERRKKADSLNSTLRQAKAIFSKDAMNLYDESNYVVPYPESFMNVSFLRNTKRTYRLPEYDKIEKIFLGLLNLREQQTDIYICLILALYVGLRHEEISQLPRSAIRKTNRWRAHITDQPDFTVKDYEERDIPIPDKLAEHILNLTDPESDYLIAGHLTYRTHTLPDTVNEYLRAQGLDDIQKPTHELRKWYGSAINYVYSLKVAQHRLGHANDSTTKKSYVDNRMTQEQAGLWTKFARKLYDGPAFTKRD